MNIDYLTFVQFIFNAFYYTILWIMKNQSEVITIHWRFKVQRKKYCLTCIFAKILMHVVYCIWFQLIRVSFLHKLIMFVSSFSFVQSFSTSWLKICFNWILLFHWNLKLFLEIQFNFNIILFTSFIIFIFFSKLFISIVLLYKSSNLFIFFSLKYILQFRSIRWFHLFYTYNIFFLFLIL